VREQLGVGGLRETLTGAVLKQIDLVPGHALPCVTCADIRSVHLVALV
jgi:hypothetical protein